MNSSSFINTDPILLSQRLSPSSQTWQFGLTALSAVLVLLFCMYVLFIQYTCSTYFLFFCVFFLAIDRSQHFFSQWGYQEVQLKPKGSVTLIDYLEPWCYSRLFGAMAIH